MSMLDRVHAASWVITLLWCSSLRLLAQPPPNARIGYVYPAGGQRGTTVEVIVGGQSLRGTRATWISGSGIQAEVVDYTRPLTPNEARDLREELAKLVEKRKTKGPSALSPAEQQRIEQIRRELSTRLIRRPSSQAIAEVVTLRISIEPDATPGRRELRLRTPFGLTNPLPFFVDSFPHIVRPPIRLLPAVEELIERNQRGLAYPLPRQDEPLEIQLPAVLDGQMLPGAVHSYRFQARRGQNLVAIVQARELVPYIADAVPGWFQAAIQIRNREGITIAAADHFRFQPDPVLHCLIPADGTYTLEIRDSLYRGRQDFVYRVVIGELPYVTWYFPMGGQVGRPTRVRLTGWNLPVQTLFARPTGEGLWPLKLPNSEIPYQQLAFAADRLPEWIETREEPNKLTRVRPPVILNGRIDQPGDWDTFEFRGEAGQWIVADVIARRLGSPLDSVIKLLDPSGRLLAMADDGDVDPSGLLTHYADAYLQVRLPVRGIYKLLIGDVQGRGGLEYTYRLRLAPPQPDFDLRVCPASVNLRAGYSIPVQVHAIRKDGFDGPIRLRLTNAPAGLTLEGGLIPAGQQTVRVTLTAAPHLAPQLLTLELEGEASINGATIKREALAAESFTQAFAYQHLVPAGAWLLEILEGRQRLPWRLASPSTIRLSPGGEATVRLQVTARRLPPQWSGIHVELSEPPDGISIREVRATGETVEVILAADKEKAKPGLRGNLILETFTRVTLPTANAPRRSRQVSLGYLPAVPFEIVPAT